MQIHGLMWWMEMCVETWEMGKMEPITIPRVNSCGEKGEGNGQSWIYGINRSFIPLLDGLQDH